MQEIVFDLALFADPDPEGIRRGRKTLLWLMQALVEIDVLYLSDYRDTPPLYETDVIYQIESSEQWKDVPRIIEDGWGDCEDLACWRIAELRIKGINARPYIKWQPSPRNPVMDRYHAVVKWPDGRIEDPSRSLGMHGHPMTRAPVWIKP